MTDRWRQVEALYHAPRAAFLSEACGADAALRREVESLLAQGAASGEFLERLPPVRARIRHVCP